MTPSTTLRNSVDDRRGSPMSNGHLHVEPRTRSLTGVQILGTGSYVPENVVSNHDLRLRHTGLIRMDRQSHGDPRASVRLAPPGDQRPVCPGRETGSQGGGLQTLRRRPAGRRDLHPRYAFPLDGEPGPGRMRLTCPAFDIQAACRDSSRRSSPPRSSWSPGRARGHLIGRDCNSRVINPNDQKSFPSSATGRGGWCLPRGPGTGARGLSARIRWLGGRPLAGPRAAAASLPRPRRSAGLALPDHGRPRGLQVGRADPDGFDARRPRQGRDPGGRLRWFVPHQANVRIIHAASDVLGFPRDAVFKTWNGTATPPPVRSRSPSTRSSGRRGSIAATCC